MRRLIKPSYKEITIEMEILKLVKELGFETLPMMTEFIGKWKTIKSGDLVAAFGEERVRAANNSEPLETGHELINIMKMDVEIEIYNYYDLIIQPFTLGQFIPCDKEGNLLIKPNFYSVWIAQGCPHMPKAPEMEKECKEYQQAVDAVLFEGWRHDTNASDEDVIFLTDGMNCLEFEEGSVVTLNECDPVETLESAINDGAELTPIIK